MQTRIAFALAMLATGIVVTGCRAPEIGRHTPPIEATFATERATATLIAPPTKAPTSPPATPTPEESSRRPQTLAAPAPTNARQSRSRETVTVNEPAETLPEDLARAATTALTQHLGVNAEQAERMAITEWNEVLWPDGSLGCAQEGYAYTQAEVHGIRAVVRYDGNEYAVHLDRDRARAIVAVDCYLPGG